MRLALALAVLVAVTLSQEQLSKPRAPGNRRRKLMKLRARVLEIKEAARLRMDNQRMLERQEDMEAERRMTERMASDSDETPEELSLRGVALSDVLLPARLVPTLSEIVQVCMRLLQQGRGLIRKRI